MQFGAAKMASVLDQSQFCARISDDDWSAGDTGSTATHLETLTVGPSVSRRSIYSFLDGHLIIEDRDPLPRWLPDAIRSLDELGCLPPNWDSYGADTIRHSSILATIELLLAVMRDDTPLPSFVPTSRRTVLLEWHMRGFDLEVEVRAPGRLHVVFEDARHGIEWESELTSDLTRLVDCIAQLTANC
jgi:hypothetical protein